MSVLVKLLSGEVHEVKIEKDYFIRDLKIYLSRIVKSMDISISRKMETGEYLTLENSDAVIPEECY